MAGVTVRDLIVEYRTGAEAVRPIDEFSMEAADGELVALLGPSGSGKTTLLSCLAGLLSPTSGSIVVAGEEVAKLSGRALEDHRKTRVGVIFQAFNLIASLTARDNVAVPLRIAGWKPKAARARAELLLTQVGLAERMHHRPGSMSGGQQQRVAIARALTLDPPVILADEPTAHLDHVQVEGILNLLRSIASPGRTVIVATHDDRMTVIADRAVDLAPIVDDASGAGRVELAPGEVLFAQGDRGHLIYEVESGEIELVRTDDDAEEEVLRVAEPGSYFGELGPILGLPRSAAARAKTNAVVVGYSVHDFRQHHPLSGPSGRGPAA